MVQSNRISVVADTEAEQLAKFIKNVKKADTISEKYRGNFVAIYEERVVGCDTEYKDLLKNISKYQNEKELYIKYIPRTNEAL